MDDTSAISIFKNHIIGLIVIKFDFFMILGSNVNMMKTKDLYDC